MTQWGETRHMIRRRKTCRSGKMVYDDEAAVRLYADKCGMGWYHCPFCRRWHLTTQRQVAS